MLLVKNAEIYAPEYLGKKDLLICGGKIECIQDSIRELPVECEVLDAEGKILTPGFLDQHVHITGGGGEGSFHTLHRLSHWQLSWRSNFQSVVIYRYLYRTIMNYQK